MKKILTVFTALVVVFGFASQVAAKDVSMLKSKDMQKQAEQLTAVLEQEALSASSNYENDYKAFLSIFSQKTYNEVITDAKYFLGKSGEVISYDGKEYTRVALLHAALHNLVLRKHIAPNDKDFTLEHKVFVMPVVYDIAKRVGLNPADEDALFNFAKGIISNSERYFYPKSYFADAFPGLASADAKQKAQQGKEKNLQQIIGVAHAMAVLPLVSNTAEQKEQSVKVIYDLSNAVLNTQSRFGVIILKVGQDALKGLKAQDKVEQLNRKAKKLKVWYFPDNILEDPDNLLKYAPEVLYKVKTIRPMKTPGEMMKKTNI